MSYLLLHRWFVATIAMLFVAWVIVEIREWRKRRRTRGFVVRSLKRMYIDAEPWKDPRDSQRIDQEFRRQHPSRFA